MSTLFLFLNYGILPFWALLAFAPRWRWTQKIVGLTPLLLAPLYAFLLFTDHTGGSIFSLAGVMTAFSSPQTTVAGWIHYLIGDLFVGAWEVRDARRLEIKHAFVVPSLVLTLMFGPIGLASWLVLRYALRGAKKDRTAASKSA